MSKGIVLSLCDLSGIMVEPWLEDGYKAVLVDPQHEEDSFEGHVSKLARTVEEASEIIGTIVRSGQLRMVFAFPPCTDLAVSGARWFRSKYEEDPLFQAKAVAVAEQCRTIGKLSGCPWMVENPVSVLSSVFGKPTFSCHPYEFAGLAPEENYTKKTCLWTGNGFIEPPRVPNSLLGEPDDRILKAPETADRQRKRSVTPMGFARAVWIANHSHTN